MYVYIGSTALHKAAANNEVDCLRVLHEFHAVYVINTEGKSGLTSVCLNRSTISSSIV